MNWSEFTGKYERFVVYAILAALVCASGYFYYSINMINSQIFDMEMTNNVIADESAHVPEPTPNVMFYICGAVEKEGTYTLQAGSRIIDAIEAAGGATETADISRMESAAAVITDGQKIYIPSVDDDADTILEMNNISPAQGTAQKSENVVEGEIININVAAKETLMRLPGVGASTAEAIIRYREENGGFSAIEDIQNVPKIGAKTFENFKKFITVGN